MSALGLGIATLVLILGILVIRRGDETVSMPTGATSTGEPPSVEGFLRAGRKIDAIKLYREETGLGLKEAKDAIDKLSLRLRPN